MFKEASNIININEILHTQAIQNKIMMGRPRNTVKMVSGSVSNKLCFHVFDYSTNHISFATSFFRGLRKKEIRGYLKAAIQMM